MIRAILPAVLLLGCAAPPASTPSTPGSTPDDTGAPTDPGTTPPVETSCSGLDVLSLASDEGATLSDGSPATLVHGPQGGWHIGLSGEVVGAPTGIEVLPTVTVLATGEQVAGDQPSQTGKVWDWTPEGCAGTFVGIIAYLDDRPNTGQSDICELVGQELRVHVLARSLDGTEEDEHEVTVVGVADPGDDC